MKDGQGSQVVLLLVAEQKAKAETQVEQRSIRSGLFSTRNLDLSLDLSMGLAQWEIKQTNLPRE